MHSKKLNIPIMLRTVVSRFPCVTQHQIRLLQTLFNRTTLYIREVISRQGR